MRPPPGAFSAESQSSWLVVLCSRCPRLPDGVLEGCEGLVRRDCEISAVSSLFGHPVVAAALGALLGVLLTLVSRRASRLVTPDDPMRGFAIYGAIMVARMFVVVAALAIFYVVAPDGLAPFGMTLGISFIAGLAYEAVKASRFNASHTSA